jgi:sugar phosphate isomerase/epimerase
MWAEWANASDAPRQPDDDPRWVCELEVNLTVLDLRKAATRRALRVGVAGLIGPWSPDVPNRDARRVARAAAALGVDGVIAPSAATEDGWNRVVLPGAFERVRMRRRRRETAPAFALSAPPTERG